MPRSSVEVVPGQIGKRPRDPQAPPLARCWRDSDHRFQIGAPGFGTSEFVDRQRHLLVQVQQFAGPSLDLRVGWARPGRTLKQEGFHGDQEDDGINSPEAFGVGLMNSGALEKCDFHPSRRVPIQR